MSMLDHRPTAPGVAPELGRVVLAGARYTVERNFGRLPHEIGAARISQVAVDAKARVHVLRRGAVPVVVFVADGSFLYSYGVAMIFDAHGITVDHRDRVWIADRDAHQILCFSSAGELVLTIGERHVPRWEHPFNHPTKVAVAGDGEIYVADGYGNARVHRFGPDGDYQSSFGAVGHGPGEFMTPHAILVDRRDRVLVCDRENDRVQLFDRDGAWIEAWHGLCRPMDLCEDADGMILVTDQVPSVTAFSPRGERVDRARPSLNGAHGIARDAAGDLYLAEIEPTSVTKLSRSVG
jgi:6-bladed beta-propeller